jgi:transposase-like protein
MRVIQLSRRTFTEEFKLAAVHRLQAGIPIRELSGELEVSRNMLYRWAREFRKGPGEAFPGNGQRHSPEGRVADLERKIGQQALEIDYLKKCLQRIEDTRMHALRRNQRSPDASVGSQHQPKSDAERNA